MGSRNNRFALEKSCNELKSLPRLHQLPFLLIRPTWSTVRWLWSTRWQSDQECLNIQTPLPLFLLIVNLKAPKYQHRTISSPPQNCHPVLSTFPYFHKFFFHLTFYRSASLGGGPHNWVFGLGLYSWTTPWFCILHRFLLLYHSYVQLSLSGML